MIVREGTLEPNERVTVGFGLLGPNRQVRLGGRCGAPARARGRVEVTCGSTFRGTSADAASRSDVARAARIGPGQCEASIVNTGTERGRFRFTVRLGLRD